MWTSRSRPTADQCRPLGGLGSRGGHVVETSVEGPRVFGEGGGLFEKGFFRHERSVLALSGRLCSHLKTVTVHR